MVSVSRWLITLAVAFSVNLPASTQEAAAKADADLPPVPIVEGDIDLDQIREELGINGFTAPSIENILAELMDLRPIPLDKLWRDFKGDTPQDRALIAISSGRVIADGLLAVIAEKPSRVEPCARALIRYAKGLGVSDYVNKHSKSILEKASKESWLEVRRELVKAQADIEAGMMALKDEEIAHLVSLGGWIRGIEIVAALVALDYSPERAARLVQPEALDYFIDRIGTLNPRLRRNEIFGVIETNLKSIRILSGSEEKPASEEDVKKIRNLAGAIVDRL
jgi:hypothetical protein